jgi:hypothetical protein
MANDEPPKISPELASLYKELGLIPPQTDDWIRLTKDLKLSTKSRHLFTVQWVLGTSFGNLFETLGIEVVSRIPDFHVLDYFIDNEFDQLPGNEQMRLIESWVKRVRIYYLYKRVTPERVAIISPFTDRHWTATPFIEAIWEQGCMTQISMLGFASTPQDRRAEDAAVLSKGMELLRDDIKPHDLRQMVVKIFADTSKRRGGDQRPEWKKELWSEDKVRQFALLVKELTPKWRWIKSNDYDPSFFKPHEWIDELRKRPDFSGLFSAYKELTDDLLLRLTDNNLSEADRQPLRLACMHAAHELGVVKRYIQNGKKPPSVNTLIDWYKKGLKLIPKNRMKQS